MYNELYSILPDKKNINDIKIIDIPIDKIPTDGFFIKYSIKPVKIQGITLKTD